MASIAIKCIRSVDVKKFRSIPFSPWYFPFCFGNTNTNLLVKVVDDGQDNTGFIDSPTNTTNDYAYDANGNMISDKNKNITSIKYNHLNLPTEITFGDGNSIQYIYNAAGQKLKKFVGAYTVTTGNSYVKEVDYLDGFQYTGGELNFFPHAEGYVNVVLGTTGNRIYNYVYNYTDHLGNIRLSYTKDMVDNKLKIMDENHYYPFGLKHQKYTAAGAIGINAINENTARPGYATSTPYAYKYNGFEYQDELGLNWYDYKARNYDPALGRWINIDPLSEMSRKYSPYAYALNNPVYFIDSDGMLATPPDWYIDAATGALLGQDGATTNDIRVINGADWRGVANDFGSTTSPEATAYLQENSSIITINEEQIQSDIDAINNATIGDQSAERQAYIGLNVDKSGAVPTAELTSTQGPVGTDGEVTSSIDSRSNGSGSVTSRNFSDTKLVPVAQVHTHNLTSEPGMVNVPGTSQKDINTANSQDISVYAIDSYTGVTEGGNAIHSVTSGGTQTNNIGTTSSQNIGQDALNNLTGQ